MILSFCLFMKDSGVSRDERVRPFLIDSGSKLEPIFAEVNSDIYDIRRKEAVLVLGGGLCPFYKIPGDKRGCNHCSLPTYSLGRFDLELFKSQVDFSFDKLENIPDSGKIKSISMYNAGSAFNPKEISREGLFYFFSKASEAKNSLPFLDRVSVESRDIFVNSRLVRDSIDALDGLKLEVAFGFESLDERVRNGDADNSRGMIGLDKRVYISRFEDAVGCVAGLGGDARFYVMMGPVPWLGREGSIEDAVNTVGYLRELTVVNKIPTFIHFNPMYAAKGSVLYDVWQDAFLKEGKSLPGALDVVSALEKIDSEVSKIGKDDFYVYLGLDSEELGDLGFGFENFHDAFMKFNRNQDMRALVGFRDEFVRG